MLHLFILIICFCLPFRYYSANSDTFRIAGMALKSALFSKKNKVTKYQYESRKTKMKKTNFLFPSATIVIFISNESLILGDLKNTYIVGEILNIFLHIGVNISLGLSILRNRIKQFFCESWR